MKKRYSNEDITSAWDIYKNSGLNCDFPAFLGIRESEIPQTIHYAGKPYDLRVAKKN